MSSLNSDLLSGSVLFGDFDVVWLEVLFTAFVKVNSGCVFSLSRFHMVCSLGCILFFGFGGAFR